MAEFPEEVNYLWVFDVEAQFDINSLMASPFIFYLAALRTLETCRGCMSAILLIS